MRTTLEKIEYALTHIRRQRPSDRQFDGCFEDGDQDAVCKGIVQVSLNDPEVNKLLPHYISTSSIKHFAEEIERETRLKEFQEKSKSAPSLEI